MLQRGKQSLYMHTTHAPLQAGQGIVKRTALDPVQSRHSCEMIWTLGVNHSQARISSTALIVLIHWVANFKCILCIFKIQYLYLKYILMYLCPSLVVDHGGINEMENYRLSSHYEDQRKQIQVLLS